MGNLMTKLSSDAVRRALLSAAALTLTLTSLFVQAAETGEVREVYACNYINGADRDDLMSARDNLIKQSDKLDIKLNTYLWTPMAGTNGEIDFLWQNHYENYNAFGALSDKYARSPEGQSAQAKFDDIIECTSSINARTEIFNGGGEIGGNPPVTISVTSCQLNHGNTMASSIPDLITHIQGTLADMPEFKSVLGYMMVPMVSQADVDLRFIGVNNSTAEYTAGSTALQTSEAGQMLSRHFQSVLDCKTSLWNGERIIIND
jgi:hypothetical protein